MRGLAPAQLAVLNQLFAQAGLDTVPGEWLISGSVSLVKLNLSQLDTRYASVAQGLRADSATQPSDDWLSSVAGVSAYVLVSNAANGDTAYGWGNHASAGYLTSAPKLKYQVDAAIASGAVTLTLSEAPTAGSNVMVAVAGAVLYPDADPPGVGLFYHSGTTLKVNTAAGGDAITYYQA